MFDKCLFTTNFSQLIFYFHSKIVQFFLKITMNFFTIFLEFAFIALSLVNFGSSHKPKSN